MNPVPATSSETFPVTLVPGAGCARFASRVIRGLDPQAKAPAWMQERLRRAGLRSISAAVDVTNYVMLELGQPMHAYDLRELEGGIVVRRATAGESLKLLDGRDITLDPDRARDCRREKTAGAGRRHGRRAFGHRRYDHRRAARGRILPARCDCRPRPPLWNRHGCLATFRTRRRSHACRNARSSVRRNCFARPRGAVPGPTQLTRTDRANCRNNRSCGCVPNVRDA